MKNIAILGNLAIDRIKRPFSRVWKEEPGGAAWYSSIAARSLGVPVHVMSNIGTDFPQRHIETLRRVGIDTRGICRTCAPTTRFVIRYYGKVRRLRLAAKCHSLNVDRLVSAGRLRGAHVGAIAGEISFDVVSTLKDRCEILSLDLQGFLRTFGPKGKVILRPSIERETLALANIIKGSDTELSTLTGNRHLLVAAKQMVARGLAIVLATRGEKGTLAVSQDGSYVVPA